MSEAVKNNLRSHGLKATPARVQVLQILQTSNHPLRIEDIHQNMKGAADPATVYRITNALVTTGLVQQVDLGEQSTYFESTDRTHHHHLVCTQCGTITDIHYCPAHLEEKALALAGNFSRIQRHSLELFGVCKRCNQ